jgi:serine/threonine protein kinase
MTDAWLGRTLSHYEIVEKLGQGGMGVVYKARDLRLERFVAIKLLRAEKLVDTDRTRRFIQEAKAASALNHPNIITIHEIAQEFGSDFMVMEYVPGKTLDHAIPRHGLHINEALKYAVQIADALATAHEAGIVHRDLKPGNVMVTEKGQVKVLDFGLAKLTEKSDPNEAATQTLPGTRSPLTGEGTLLGTVAYMSPEQAEGKEVDSRSDIFSFGSLLYEMLTGRRAFSGDSRLSTLSAILREEPKLQAQSGDAIPRDLEKIITRCLRKDRARRVQTMADLKVSLEEVKEESESGRQQNLPPAPAAHRRALLLYAAVGVLLLAAAPALWWRSRAPVGPTPGGGLTLRQLTQNSGRTSDPDISPDGKLVAYSSDRAGDAGMDIWVQQLTAGAEPIRLTRNKADDVQPSFSPDGGRIVFSSGRDGGGVYVIPALGGEEQLLLRGSHYGPRFSPDGQWVATWTAVGQNARIVVTPVAGGAPHPIAQDFYFAVSPVWSPDSTRILFAGRRQVDPLDWWVAPLDSGSPVITGAADVLAKILSPGTFPGPGVPPLARLASGVAR